MAESTTTTTTTTTSVTDAKKEVDPSPVSTPNKEEVDYEDKEGRLSGEKSAESSSVATGDDNDGLEYPTGVKLNLISKSTGV